MTNGEQAYALFTYNCHQMDWSGRGGIGVNADGGFYINHKFSGSRDANQVACQNFPESEWSNELYYLCKLRMMV